MSQNDTFTPIIGPDGITLNLNRGLKGMLEGLIRRVPNGPQALNGGLRKVIHRAIDEGIPQTEFTAETVAEKLGILKPRRKRRK